VKAIRIHGRGGPEQLFFEDAPLPEVRSGDVLVRVRATGITPTELTWDESYQNADGTARIPGIPGHEVAGVVERMAPDITDFRPGDEVYGLADFPRDGAAAEFAAVRAANLALKPHSISHEQAAALPLSALTAWQALFEHGHLASGQSILIHGGAANMWRDDISLRWNYHLLAKPGYVLLMTNYTGSTDAQAAAWVTASNVTTGTDAFHFGTNNFAGGAVCP